MYVTPRVPFVVGSVRDPARRRTYVRTRRSSKRRRRLASCSRSRLAALRAQSVPAQCPPWEPTSSWSLRLRSRRERGYLPQLQAAGRAAFPGRCGTSRVTRSAIRQRRARCRPIRRARFVPMLRRRSIESSWQQRPRGPRRRPRRGPSWLEIRRVLVRLGRVRRTPNARLR